MPEASDGTSLQVMGGIDAVDAAAWDACAGSDDPFVSHAFLSALEDSGSVGDGTGWHPCHLALDEGTGGMAACAPLYLKTHSFGEYVFDWAWADAWQRAGGQYYPKLQAAVPFTPVTGRRLLVRADQPPDRADALARGMVALARRQGLSSVHVTFPTEAEWQRLGEAGFLLRTDHQYHWHNAGYADFDAFLAGLTARRRKTIRKERRAVADSGVRLRTLEGPDITEAHWDAVWAFYRDTGRRKWGRPYLTRAFFSLLGERLADRVVLVLAEAGGRPVAGALNLRGRDALYGRYWGCLEDYRFLHFEACYYRAIDYAIEHGLARVEAGAQGEHKIQRGYLPVPTYSAHWVGDPGFADLLARHLAAERAAAAEDRAALAELSPFRKA